MAASTRKVFQLFVTKIPWTVASREMREYFGQFGPVRSCILPFDRETGFHKGFCWIGFNSEEGLLNALQKDSHIIEGTKLNVARNKDPVPRRLTKEAEES
ncbi:SRA stem-loop-interacting RNA-binding protein, mitochondrial [Scleropages formosus]|uniref:SRA stem-loop interacting RNA binding protein n=1 Tax=Scleropages formosus TaxID=113540 RepID=A0A8C9W1H2_SCLFO|nr:SRA stem-loop-interacting RNA-binding protein, mitochondrial [Scleropages formosus]